MSFARPASKSRAKKSGGRSGLAPTESAGPHGYGLAGENTQSFAFATFDTAVAPADGTAFNFDAVKPATASAASAASAASTEPAAFGSTRDHKSKITCIAPASAAAAATPLATSHSRKLDSGKVLRSVIGLDVLIDLILSYFEPELCILVSTGASVWCVDLSTLPLDAVTDAVRPARSQANRPRQATREAATWHNGAVHLNADPENGSGSGEWVRPCALRPYRILPVCETNVQCMISLPDQRIVTAARDTVLKVWDVATLTSAPASASEAAPFPEHSLYCSMPDERRSTRSYAPVSDSDSDDDGPTFTVRTARIAARAKIDAQMTRADDAISAVQPIRSLVVLSSGGSERSGKDGAAAVVIGVGIGRTVVERHIPPAAATSTAASSSSSSQSKSTPFVGDNELLTFAHRTSFDTLASCRGMDTTASRAAGLKRSGVMLVGAHARRLGRVQLRDAAQGTLLGGARAAVCTFLSPLPAPELAPLPVVATTASSGSTGTTASAAGGSGGGGGGKRNLSSAKKLAGTANVASAAESMGGFAAAAAIVLSATSGLSAEAKAFASRADGYSPQAYAWHRERHSDARDDVHTADLISVYKRDTPDVVHPLLLAARRHGLLTMDVTAPSRPMNAGARAPLVKHHHSWALFTNWLSYERTAACWCPVAAAPTDAHAVNGWLDGTCTPVPFNPGLGMYACFVRELVGSSPAGGGELHLIRIGANGAVTRVMFSPITFPAPARTTAAETSSGDTKTAVNNPQPKRADLNVTSLKLIPLPRDANASTAAAASDTPVLPEIDRMLAVVASPACVYVFLITDYTRIVMVACIELPPQPVANVSRDASIHRFNSLVGGVAPDCETDTPPPPPPAADITFPAPNSGPRLAVVFR